MRQDAEYKRQWRSKNKERLRLYHLKWRAANRAKVCAASKKWRTLNPEKQRSASRNWVNENRDHVKANERQRRATDPQYRMGKNLRCRIGDALRNHKARKAHRTLTLVGCDIPTLMLKLEEQFQDGMNWQNYGTVWEVDHRHPCASFDLTDEAQQRACFHYSNLRPLSVSQNRRKYAKPYIS